MPETRPGNANYNANMPTPTQLQAFYGATDHWGHSILTDNPYYRYVTGQYQGSTDEIIQWTAWKWGIPENVLRAQYVQESFWHQTMLGDLMTVSQSAYYQYPPQARVPVSNSVYQVYATMGISQVKWSPDGLYGAGTEPLRWQSTAFAADYEAATIRFYFDDPGGLRTAWGDPGYQSAQGWNSVGGWFESYPWMNSGQATYIGQVQGRYNSQTWTSF